MFLPALVILLRIQLNVSNRNLLYNSNEFLRNNLQVQIPVMAYSEDTVRCDNICKSRDGFTSALQTYSLPNKLVNLGIFEDTVTSKETLNHFGGNRTVSAHKLFPGRLSKVIPKYYDLDQH